MEQESLSSVLCFLHQTVGDKEAENVTDAVLLDQFLMRQDARAFDLLMHRHGPMVMGVCRRVLLRRDEAEEAFQATFLVLARKASTLGRRDLLSHWLYGVALRTAKALRRQSARWRSAQEVVPEPATEEEDPMTVLAQREVKMLVDEEIQRLPRKYRLPIILCYLEGQSYSEAARQLGCPAGTVSGRLARARDLLRDRLARRGLAPAQGAWPVILSGNFVRPQVDASLQQVTLKAAVAAVRGEPLAAHLVSANVANLTKGVVSAMTMAKVKTGLAILVAVTVLGVGIGNLAWGWQGSGQKAQAPTPEKQAEPPPARTALPPNPREPEEVADEPEKPQGPQEPIEELRAREDFLSYVNNITRAQRDLLDNDLVRARQFLDQCKPELRHWEWHYLQRLCNSERLAFHGHESPVTALAYSPDGSRVASVSGTEARLWDPNTGKELFKFSGRQGAGAAFSPDGKHLAVGWFDRVSIYDTGNGKELSSINIHDEVKERFPFPPRLGALAFSPDGRRLATAASIAKVGGPHGYPGAVVKVWDLASSKEVYRSENLSSFVNAISFSPDGKHLAGCIGGAGGELPEGGEVWVWDADGGKLVKKFQPFTRDQVDPGLSTYFLAGVSFSPDGKHMASAGSDGLIRVWNLPQGSEAFTLRGHQGWIGSIAFSPGGDCLISGGADRVVRLWDTSTSKEINALRGHASAVRVVAFSPDGKRVASAGATAKNSGVVRIWDARADQQAQTFLRDPKATGIDSVAFSPDGKLLASGSISGVTIHDVASGREQPLKERIHPAGLGGFTRVAFSPDGANVATTGANGVKLWDRTTGKMVRLFPDHPEIAQWPYTLTVGLAFSPDGKHLATVGRNLLTVWEVATGQMIHKIKFHPEKLVIGSVAYSPDGRRIATATRASVRIPAEVKLWDATTGKELLKFDGGGGELAFSPDGRRLTCCQSDGTVTVWDTTEGKVVSQLRGHSGAVHSVAFSPDGKRVVTGSADQTLMIWDARTGQEVLRLRGHGAAVVSVAFSPDGRHIASASSAEPSQVKLWSAGR